MVVSLGDIVQGDDAGSLAASPAWETIKASYRQQFLPEMAVAAEPQYQFAKRGMWVMRYDGKVTYLDGNLRGAAFIQYLIQRQGQEIPVIRMLMDIAGTDVPHLDVQAEGLSTAAANTGDLADKKTIAQCKT